LCGILFQKGEAVGELAPDEDGCRRRLKQRVDDQQRVEEMLQRVEGLSGDDA
jgi:hypothetical protein